MRTSQTRSLTWLAVLTLLAANASAQERRLPSELRERVRTEPIDVAHGDGFTPLRGTGPLLAGSDDPRLGVMPGVAWTPGLPGGGGGSGEPDTFRRFLGEDTSADGDLVAAGAFTHDAPGEVHLYRLVDGRLLEEAVLHPPEAVEADSVRFGSALSVSGNLVAVGDSFGGAEGKGAAHVFRRDAISGEWRAETVELPLPGTLDANSEFGGAVAIDGNLLAVGAKGHHQQQARGAVFVYRFDGDVWREEAELVGAPHDFFGHALALSGNLLVTSTISHDLGTFSNAGAVRIYRHDGLGWETEATVVLDEPELTAWFGRSLDVQGDELLVGAPGVSPEGVIHHYIHAEGTWNLTQVLSPPEGSECQNPNGIEPFGWRVRVAGDRLLAGHPGCDLDPTDGSWVPSGQLVTWSRGLGGWESPTILPPPHPEARWDGRFADLAGDHAILGSASDRSQGEFAGNLFVLALP